MTAFFLSITGLFFLFGCTPSNRCASPSNYVTDIDTAKPYFLEGKYCVTTIRDTVLVGDIVGIRLNVFDRRTGKRTGSGFGRIRNELDTVKFIVPDGTAYKKMKPGSYFISVSVLDEGLLGFTTKKKIELPKNKITEINIYVGSSMQW